MIIKRIKLINIRSYENQEIEFPTGSTLLSGDIGSGKSSILFALEYALFGLQPGQKGSFLLRNNSNFGEVLLEFNIDNNDIIIERRLKREGNSVINDYSAITINGQKEELSVTELKSKVLSILHYPSEFIKKNNILYRFTVYTPQEQMKQIITEDAETRLNVLRHTFGIDKYKKIRDNLTIFLNKMKEEAKLLQGEIKTLDSDKERLKSINESLISMEQKIIDKEKEVSLNKEKRKNIETEVFELEKKIKEKEMLEKEIEKTKIMISSKREHLLSLQKEFNNLNKNVVEAKENFDEQKLINIKNEILSKKSEVEKLNSKLIEISTTINSLNSNKLSFVSEKERILNLKFCPTCLQDVSETHKHNILNKTEQEISSITKKLNSLRDEQSNIKLLLEKEKDTLSNLEEEKLNLENLKTKMIIIQRSITRMEEIKKLTETLEKDIILLSNHIENLKQEASKLSKFINLLKSKQDELKNAFNIEKISEISLAELKKEIELTKKQISSLAEEIKKKEESKKKLLALLELTDWLSSQFINLIDFTERNILIKLRLEFSKLFGKWFHMLMPQDSFEVQLDENFTPLIIQGENEMEYSFLSGGERTAVALAYRLALNQTINSILSNIKTKDIVILDEPTDGFSEAQLEKMRDVFEELKLTQLIIVSHEQKIEGFVDNVIRLKKENDISKVDVGRILSF
ncbi:MAG: AAA family ATPase [Candidatus Pacearchaeota archaeon]|nr:AAA family ATPase [Candidatus Pacearchaeota archaeon]